MAALSQNPGMPPVLGQQARVLQKALVELWEFIGQELDPDPMALTAYLVTLDPDEVNMLHRSLPERCLVDPSGGAD